MVSGQKLEGLGNSPRFDTGPLSRGWFDNRDICMNLNGYDSTLHLFQSLNVEKHASGMHGQVGKIRTSLYVMFTN